MQSAAPEERHEARPQAHVLYDWQNPDIGFLTHRTYGCDLKVQGDPVELPLSVKSQLNSIPRFSGNFKFKAMFTDTKKTVMISMMPLLSFPISLCIRRMYLKEWQCNVIT